MPRSKMQCTIHCKRDVTAKRHRVEGTACSTGAQMQPLESRAALCMHQKH